MPLIRCGKIMDSRQATDDNMQYGACWQLAGKLWLQAAAHYVQYFLFFHCNTAWTPLTVTLYVHCLSSLDYRSFRFNSIIILKQTIHTTDTRNWITNVKPKFLPLWIYTVINNKLKTFTCSAVLIVCATKLL
jgi:hypothetical protein